MQRLPNLPASAIKFKFSYWLFYVSLLGFMPLGLIAQSVTGSTPSVNFGSVNICAAGGTSPAPCSATLSLTYQVTASGYLGTTKVLTMGAPDLDFTEASGSSCKGMVTAGTTCTVKVKFTPQFAGTRAGAVQVTNDGNQVLATTFINGTGLGPQIEFDHNRESRDLLALARIGFHQLYGAAVDGAGNVYVCENSPSRVLKIPGGGGTPIQVPFSGLNNPSGVAVDGAGDIFVADADNNRVVERPAGVNGQVTLPFSGLLTPEAVAVDSAGSVYAANYQKSQVLKLPSGGGAQVTLSFTKLEYPAGLAVDGAGDVFVADGGKGLLVELPAGGGAQKTTNIFENGASGIAVDGIGDVFVGGGSTDAVVEVPVNGGPVITVVDYALSGYQSGIAVDGGGNVYFPTDNGSVYEAVRSQPPAINLGTESIGEFSFNTGYETSPTISNAGTTTLTFMPSFSDPGYSLNATPVDCAVPAKVTSLDPGQSCGLYIGFSPTAVGVARGSLTLETNSLNNPDPAISLLSATISPFAPYFDEGSGVYVNSIDVSIEDLDTYAGVSVAIYYTTDGSVPTAASKPYTGPILVRSTETITAVAILDNVSSPIASESFTILPSSASADVIQGFSETGIQYNRSAFNGNGSLVLTNGAGPNQVGSGFYTTPVHINSFTTYFTFQLTRPDADGFTFTIQNTGATAIGANGGGLGFAGIDKSVAIKFDLHDNAGEGPNSTGVYVNGALPTVPSISLAGSGINLHSGDVILAQMTYDGTNLVLRLTDTISQATWSHSFPINIPATVGGDTAFVGFTGAGGTQTANQQIYTWTYVSGTPGQLPPAAPVVSTYPVPLFPDGFEVGGLNTSDRALGITTNGAATVNGYVVLTNGLLFEAGSAFYTAPVNIQAFTTDFSFQFVNPVADGFTFTVQNEGPYALGGFGESLGYAGIGKSVALKFGLRNDLTYTEESSTGLYLNGALPTEPEVVLTGGIDLHSIEYASVGSNTSDLFNAHIVYDGADLNLTLTDTVTGQVFTHAFPVNIPATVGGTTAYVGFTAGTGAETATQSIESWTFTNP